MSAFKNAVLIPANPTKNRVIRDGKYLIDDIPIAATDFKNDPEYPRNADTIQGLLIDFDANKVVEDRLPEKKETQLGKIFMPFIQSKNELDIISSRLTGEILFAGAADFFSSLLYNRLHLDPTTPSAAHNSKKHFIIGSFTEGSQQTILTLAGIGYSVFRLDKTMLRETGKTTMLSALSIQIKKALQSGESIIIAGPEEKIKEAELIGRITGKIAALFELCADSFGKNDQLCIEGGETASLISRLMQWNALEVVHAFGNGTVTLKNATRGPIITLKPGSYHWPDWLMG
jgi:uncharacterized protein YgbK (DUF1537 family)